MASRFLSKLATIYCLGDPNLGARLRSLHVRKALRSLRWNSLIDVGCARAGSLGWGGGISTNPLLIAKYHPSADVVGADIDNEAITFNNELTHREGVRNLRFLLLDLFSDGPKEKHDVIMMLDVLINGPRDKDLVAGATQLVKPGGHLIMHTTIVRAVQSGSRQSASVKGHGITESDFRAMLTSAGATEIRLSGTFGWFGQIAWNINAAATRLGNRFVVFTFPVCLFLAGLDLITKNVEGRGVVAIARVPG